jgi:hypothetical protein
MLTKRRIVYLFYIVTISTLGLLTRSHPHLFPTLVAKYGGDVLWAALFLFPLRIVLSKVTLWKLAACNYAFGILIELQQLLEIPWLVKLRHTLFGKLFLGLGFLWSDIVCYAIGTLLAWVTIWLIEKYVLPEKKHIE